MVAVAVKEQKPSGPPPEDPVVGFEEALQEEFNKLGLSQTARSALCLSGGGIRSAAFCLGVIQAFARYRLLTQFHYLSTVSGGGYIGGWLTRLIAQRFEKPLDGRDDLERRRDGEDRITDLQNEIAAPVDRAEEAAVGGLRRYTSYLTPNRGFASLDTWAGITLWLRNTLINWLVFLPVFAALAGLPILFVAVVYALAASTLTNAHGFTAHASYVGGLALFIAVIGTIVYLPSHAHPDTDTGRRTDYGLSGSEVAARIVLPIVLWCLLAAASVATMTQGGAWATEGRAVFSRHPAPAPACRAGPVTCQCSTASAVIACPIVIPAERAPTPLRDPMFRLPFLSFGTCILAYIAAFLWIAWKFRRTNELLKRHTAPFLVGIVPWVLASAASSLFLLLGIWLQRGQDLLWIAMVGPLWVAIAETLRSTIYVAMRHSGLRSDSDREWLARVNGSKLRFMIGLAAGGVVIVLGGSQLAAQSDAVWSSLIGGGAASGSIIALLGRSAGSAFASRAQGPASPGQGKAANSGGRWTAVLINAAIILFGVTLFIVVGRGFGLLAGAAATAIEGQPPSFRMLAAVSLGLVVSCAGLALMFGRWINLNRFSMHAVYRNRLIRAFLGSGRAWADRLPDRFTQFDPRDNIRLADTFTGRHASFLFPVVNVALNRTCGRDTARAERKAESFTMTPFRCGAGTLPGRGGKDFGAGAYAPTQGYACGERDTGPDDKERGITLGTAMTISGAAASPNMGYHSSPLTAFVMTLFNVRLGAWLPNPAMPRTDDAERRRILKEGGPTNEVPTLLNELLGRSDNDGDFLYLSDGGHFDNLGVYEMLRRRCRLIVVVDAGQDKDYAYEDLGRLKQNARIDFGIELEFIKHIETRQPLLASQGALAKIRYPAKDGDQAEGRLLYLKSWLPRDAPVELQAFQIRKADFPHESTGNQFFTESDFESYRLLGNYIARSIIEKGMPGAKPGETPAANALAGLFAELERTAQPLRSKRLFNLYQRRTPPRPRTGP